MGTKYVHEITHEVSENDIEISTKENAEITLKFYKTISINEVKRSKYEEGALNIPCGKFQIEQMK